MKVGTTREEVEEQEVRAYWVVRVSPTSLPLKYQYCSEVETSSSRLLGLAERVPEGQRLQETFAVVPPSTQT